MRLFHFFNHTVRWTNFCRIYFFVKIELIPPGKFKEKKSISPHWNSTLIDTTEKLCKKFDSDYHPGNFNLVFIEALERIVHPLIRLKDGRAKSGNKMVSKMQRGRLSKEYLYTVVRCFDQSLKTFIKYISLTVSKEVERLSLSSPERKRKNYHIQ